MKFISSHYADLNKSKSTHFWATILTLGTLIACANANAQERLSIEKALQIAQAHSQQLVAYDAAESASHDSAVAAEQLPDPILKSGLNSLPVTGADRFNLKRDSFTMLTVGVAQEFTGTEKRQARSQRFLREADMAKAAHSLALSNLRRQTASAWLDRYYQEQILNLLISQRTEAQLQIDAVESNYRGGRGTQADVFSARAAVGFIDDRIRQSRQQISTAKTRLHRWLGEHAELPLDTPPSISVLHFDINQIETHLSHHPEIAVIAQQEEIARADVNIAQANKRSDWSAEFSYSNRGPAYSNMVSINFSIPFQIDQKNRQDKELAAKLSAVAQVQAQREEASREHLFETRRWLEEWQSDQDRIVLYERTLIPLATQRTQAETAAYRGGNGTLSNLLAARRMEIEIQLERLRIEMEAANRWAQLEYLLPPAQIQNAFNSASSFGEK